jgi:isocitrate lyase
MFELARGYRDKGMTAYSRLQEKEFSREFEYGYQAVKHQKFVGTGYFDAVNEVITQGMSSTGALQGSTEQEQFQLKPTPSVIQIGHDPACQPILGDCPAVPNPERMAGD